MPNTHPLVSAENCIAVVFAVQCCFPMHTRSPALEIAVQVCDKAVKTITTPPHRRMADSNDPDVPLIESC